MLLKKSLANICFVVILLFQGLALAAEQTPELLLAQVVSGFKTQSYKASAVYVRPSGMDSIDIEHDGEVEHITYKEEGHSSVVTRLDKSTLKQQNGVTTELINVAHFNSLEQLHKNLSSSLASYNLFISENYDHVAGMPAVRLSVISKASDRYSYIYWVDVENHIILRTDILNENGELIERMLFTSFALKENGFIGVEKKFKKNNDQQISIRYAQSIGSNQVINSLPTGFDIISKQSAFDHANTLLYKHIVLSDGFAFIDIYIGNSGNEVKTTRGQQLDAFHVFKHEINGVKLSVEGQFPYIALKKIGLNLVIQQTND